MSKPLVLVTGATGHIGFRTLVEVLKAGYRARVSSRSLSTINKIKQAKSIQPYQSDIEHIEVPDITARGAYDLAVQNVEFVLHIASPIPILDGSASDKSVEDVYLNPAVLGTTSLLDSSLKSPTIKRVVITSSVVILAPLPSSDPDAPPIMSPTNLVPVPDPSTVSNSPFVAYRASKALSYAASENWASINEPHFSIIYLLPSYVQGANELATSTSEVGNGSNDVQLDLVLGKIQKGSAPPRAAGLVLVDDVAKVEVAALDTSKGKTGDRFAVSHPNGLVWNDIPGVARRLFPGAVKKGWIVGDEGEEERGLETVPVNFDVSDTTKVFGIKFSGLEDMVRSLVGQYIELKEKEESEQGK